MADREEVTGEVASEGGSAGDVEIHDEDDVTRGSEATETVRRVEQRKAPVARDETGEGRRSP